uniref:Uncharacterized protein n=1 Tax=Acrobeloides nanus TaxID=290746 RepID=A0A914E3H6_9BILA
DRDPFYEPPDSSIAIGSVNVFLQSLAYMIELDEQFPILDFHGTEIGQLSVSLLPCNPSGKEILGEFVENPNEIVGKNLGFKVKILNGMGLPRRIEKSWCKYRFFDQPEVTTNQVSGFNPAYGHDKVFVYRTVTKELVRYLKESSLSITIYATQKGRDASRQNSVSSKSSSYITQKTMNGESTNDVHLSNGDNNVKLKSKKSTRDSSKSKTRRKDESKTRSSQQAKEDGDDSTSQNGKAGNKKPSIKKKVKAKKAPEP